MNPLRAWPLLCALLVPWAMLAQAAKPQQEPAAAVASEPALSGHYYLQGVMETGSELMLGDDGRFQWYFSYGALDLLAKGRWHREGDRVVLVPDDFRSPPDYSQLAFKRMQLRVDGKDLVPAWPWEDGAERGRYVAE
ncbi:hypothetical protein J2X04_000050 [Lysobacter niabensis]|uniref:Uncharacterized protein n=1 Tax=Agrilutibacter niabensis TaxID=380628 RepID=A0ABU1VK91_9GAMM|nr:hypothetical protein [Lysobacter niabensis]MDR7097703.1 hypothetical protein [Lysobacter niabensis]